MKKKWKLLMLSALCASCFSVAVACSPTESEKTVQLPEFLDETVDIEIGEMVYVHDFLKAYDEEGNLYSATFELTDSASNPVQLLKNEFTVEDSIGYTLKLSLRDPKTGEIIATRTVQLRTVDKSAPLISIGDFAEYGTVDETFTMPLIFTDASGNFNTSVTVLRVPYSVAANGYDESIAEPVESQHVSKSGVATFTPTTGGRYKVLVEAWDGEDKEEAQSASLYNSKVTYIDVKGSPLEIEGFDTPDCLELTSEKTYAVYGARAVEQTNGTVKYYGDKNYLANNAAWYESKTDGAGVTKYGVVSMTSAYLDTYGRKYFVGSSVRNRYFMGGDVADNNAASLTWDYISVWIYIDGTEGETVEVSMNYDVGAQQVPFNTWYEYRVYKWACVRRDFYAPNRTFSTYSHTGNWDMKCILNVGKSDSEDYTVYLDSLTYVNDAADAFDITATASGVAGAAGTVSVTATVKEEYADKLANATYSYVIQGYLTTTRGKQKITTGKISADGKASSAYTAENDVVWICVYVELDGVYYVSELRYVIPTEA